MPVVVFPGVYLAWHNRQGDFALQYPQHSLRRDAASGAAAGQAHSGLMDCYILCKGPFAQIHRVEGPSAGSAVWALNRG